MYAGLTASLFALFSHRGMKDSAFGELSGSPGSAYFSSYLPLLGGTPAVYLDDEFLTYLDGEEALEDFEVFLKSDLLSKIYNASDHRGAGVGAGYPLWLKLQDALPMLDDLRQGRHSPGGASTFFSYEEENNTSEYATHSLGLLSSENGAAAENGDATLRSDRVDQSYSRLPALFDDDGKQSTSLSPPPSSVSSETSGSPGTQPRDGGKFDYYNDDNVEGMLNEIANQ